MTIGSHMKARISGMLSPFLQPSERRAPRRLGHEGLQQRSKGEAEALAALGEEQTASAPTRATQKAKRG